MFIQQTEEALVRLTRRGRWQVKIPGMAWVEIAEKYQEARNVRMHCWEKVKADLERQFPRFLFRLVMPNEEQRLSIAQESAGGRG